MEPIQEGARAATVLPASSAQAGEQPRVVVSQAGGEFLIFNLGAEEYGIDIQHVQEIRSYDRPTSIANAPAFIKGVINLRGVITPILDLRIKFSLKSVKYDELTVVIVVNIGKRVVGVVVDSVSDVLALDSGQISPVPELSSAADVSFITGIGSVPGDGHERMLILVDIDNLISSADVGLHEMELH
ncbi:Chemotaxis protein CheW (plasmid) [Caballeronia sp. SBC1]|uniref:chemotaxis protein CheW n=1 Tax=unclassified Caballeronia TaxID=2646786 RepID=UPI0013E1147D|nr:MULTISPECIES: chemotaxis protein CheW [unclassified Caballeronia]QIE29218.1 Chemotaxis protein CheW [Caballeronia sp. SBC2]QIN67285.1 Chemotaxis protein CheW [Caballeronia sp. SBC1]